MLHEDRLLPSDPSQRAIARRLYAEIRNLPIVSPHGHTDPAWFAENKRFPNPAALFVIPDHYVFRMFYSQGIRMEDLGVPRADGGAVETDPRKIWRLFADNWYLLRGTPSRMWLDHAFSEVFGLDQPFGPKTADAFYDHIDACLAKPGFLPRALFERFNIEALATTEAAIDPLVHHRALKQSGWTGRVVTTFRPDAVVDPEFEGFAANLDALGQASGEDTGSWAGYLRALAERRAFFKTMGATATDHGHLNATTADLPQDEAAKLYARARKGGLSAAEADLFRGQMLTEMARMSLDDGLVMQIHPGAFRNHNQPVFERFGRDKGCDIPIRTEYVAALKPLLNRFGNEPGLTIIVFTLDETTFSRELAPLAGHYPALRLGPPWWFLDSPEGMRRARETAIETAGFYNTVGFNDDTRAFCSIPARHDVARRIDCGFLARQVAEHRLGEDEAREVAVDLTYTLVKKAYRL
jgi:glucuronate isomerase